MRLLTYLPLLAVSAAMAEVWPAADYHAADGFPSTAGIAIRLSACLEPCRRGARRRRQY